MMRNAPQAPAPANSPSSEQPARLLSFSEHIKELRRRLLWVGLVFLIGSSVAYQFHDQLVQTVLRPLAGQKLVYLTPGGGFSFIFQITLYAGLLAAAPMLMYQLYGFVKPALPVRARRSAVRVVGCALVLLAVGIGYGYFVAVPAALHFLSTFAGSQVLPNLTADSYLNFFLSYVAGLGLLFQLPLLLMFWHGVHPLTPGGLLKSERWVILFAFVAAALITPTPDVFNQLMIALPLLAVYQLGMIAVLVSIARRKRTVRSTRAAAPAGLPQLTASVSVPSAPQPFAAAPSPAPSRMRSIDGLTRRPVIGVPAHSSVKPQASPAPSSRPVKPLLYRRANLSIDGISHM